MKAWYLLAVFWPLLFSCDVWFEGGQTQSSTADKLLEIGWKVGQKVPDAGAGGENELFPDSEIRWDDLIPEGYEPQVFMEKYQQQIADLTDEDAEQGYEVYKKLQEEFANAPVNQKMDGKQISILGFIAPLEETGGIIRQFLLVPYYGSCIHIPPPPINQTILVTPGPNVALTYEDTYDMVRVSGILQVQRSETFLASSGYTIKNANTYSY